MQQQASKKFGQIRGSLQHGRAGLSRISGTSLKCVPRLGGRPKGRCTPAQSIHTPAAPSIASAPQPHSPQLPSSSTVAVAQKPPEADPETSAESRATPFNWGHQWYPVHLARDIPEGQPTRVWLFDEAIVVLRRPGQSPVAMLDRCPHRGAALSEGRMTTTGNIQCAYHGWAFDGESGKVVSIPQVKQFDVTPRTCGKALACREHQGLLWVCPTPGFTPPLDALTGLPELDREGWTSDDFVRDMPVDFSLLIENVADPDHGVFAHQTPTFDTFTASAEHPMSVVTEPGRTGQKVVGRVPGMMKMLLKTPEDKDKALPGEAGNAADVTATIEFEPPCFVRWSRIDGEGNCKFISSFYASPQGTGRTRFFVRYSRSLIPWFHPPGWLVNILINGFVDQDTYLLATQQEAILGEEFARNAGASADPEQRMKRRRIFTYRSPTDNFLVSVGKWLDDALSQVPNRYNLPGGAIPSVTREQVLDRYACQTAISQESAQAYAAFKNAARVLGFGALFGATALVAYVAGSVGAGNLDWPSVFRWAIPVLLTSGGAAAAKAFEQQFTYVYTPARQAKDLARIPSLVADK